MAELKFICPQCKQPFEASGVPPGQPVSCPSCNTAMAIPRAPATPPPLPPEAGWIFCFKCGEKNAQNNYKCVRCGTILHAPPTPPPCATADDTLGGLIPYRNAQALWAYYLGIFSFIPCVGIPLGITALILGLRGLKYARLHPEARGTGHAWAGIILGSLCAVGYSLAILTMVMMGVFS